MAYDYASLRDNVVYPLIVNYGTPIVLLRKANTATLVKKYDPALKAFYWVNTETDERFDVEPGEYSMEYNGFAVITKYRNEEVDGTVIKRGDIRLLAIGIPLPVLGDIITVAGQTYNYVHCDPVSPGAVDVVYKIQVRI